MPLSLEQVVWLTASINHKDIIICTTFRILDLPLDLFGNIIHLINKLIVEKTASFDSKVVDVSCTYTFTLEPVLRQEYEE